MAVLVMLSQALLYISFAILMGNFILRLVPEQHRPAIYVPQKVLLISVLSVPILAFFPVLEITLYIAPRLGFFEALQIVLLTYTIGTAWDATLFISLILLFVITRTQQTKLLSFVGMMLTILLMLALAWSSHAAAMDKVLGVTSDMIHLIAMSVWVGILLVVGYFATNTQNWIAFLNWFTYTAIGCVATLAISGFLLMDILVDGYINAWMVDYGQGMLLKHLLVVPILLFAGASSLIARFKLSRNTDFNPLPWMRLEGLLLGILLIVTGAFTQQPPPGHNVTTEALSPIFKWFHPDVVVEAGSSIGFVVNIQSVLFLFGSLLSIIALVGSFFLKKSPPAVSFIIGCIVVLCIYFLLMTTSVIRPPGFMGGGMGH